MKKTIAMTALALAFTLSFAVSSRAATAEFNYKYYCASCHGLGGKGNGPNATDTQPVKPRNHTDPVEMKKLTDADLVDVIKNGGVATSRSRMMPPFKATLTDAEIKELVKHLRGLCRCTAASR
jgi:mono/diheme cytochrome c family protein